MKVVFSASFKRSLRTFFRRHPELRKTFETKVKEFAQNPFDPSLKTHNLGGKLSGLRSFSVTHDYRIIFELMPMEPQSSRILERMTKFIKHGTIG